MLKNSIAMNITKNDIVNKIFDKSVDIEKKQIQQIINLFFEEVKIGLESGAAIELRGFGTFETRLRKEKTNARDPRTGKIVNVEAHHVAAFRSGKELKDKLWNMEKNE